MLKQMKLADIKIGKRYRKDFGDIAGLAADIKNQGLLVPLGVAPDKTLVYGERRLRALKKLNRKTADVFIIETARDAVTIRKMEEAENNLHKPLTPTEKLMLREAIMKAESKAGQRSDLNGKSHSGSRGKQLQQRANEVAQRAGFRSHDEYRATKKVVESGDKALIELVNKSADPQATREEGLSAFEAVAVLEAPPARRKTITTAPEPRTALRESRARARTNDQMCSDMTQKVWRAMAPINWIVDGYAPDEGYMEGAFEAFAKKPPMSSKANKAGLPGLLEAVKEVRQAYQMFERELKEVINK